MHRKAKGLALLAAALTVFTIGMSAALVTTAAHPSSNAANILFGQTWDMETPEGQDVACGRWNQDPTPTYAHWAAHGINAAGMDELAALLNSRCSTEV